MRKLKVLNRHRDIIPENAIYVGRGTPFGNPFKDEDRNLCLLKFRAYLESDCSLMSRVRVELKGHDLVCSCVPYKRCHAEILLEIANKEIIDRNLSFFN